MGPAAWQLLRDAVADDPLLARPDRLPAVPARDVDAPAAHRALVEQGVLRPDGAVAAPVRVGLRLLGSAPVTVAVDRRTAVAAVQARWASLGVPTAGVAVTRRRRGDHVDVEVELQLLAGAHLVPEVTTALGLPMDTGDAGGGRLDLLEAATSGHLPAPLDAVVVDGAPALHVRLQVSGPAGTGVATIVGDGTRAWQLGARDRATVAWRAVDGPAVARTLRPRVAEQLAALGGRDGRP